MQKYHKDIGFLPCHVQEALSLIEALQNRDLIFSFHALQELSKEREAVFIGRCIKDYRLVFSDVFELVFNAGRLEKIGFRIAFSENKDIIFMLSRQKIIITLWTNSKKDIHKTLKTSLYCKV